MKPEDYPRQTILRAAKQSYARGDAILDFDDELRDTDMSPNMDPKLGSGLWVAAYVFVSLSEIQDAEDNTP